MVDLYVRLVTATKYLHPIFVLRVCYSDSEFLSETVLILRRIQRDIITNLHRTSCKVPFNLVTFFKLEFSQYILEKSSNIKFHETFSYPIQNKG
jgi:hypothetical protein